MDKGSSMDRWEMFCGDVLPRLKKMSTKSGVRNTALHAKLEFTEELFVPSLEESVLSGTRCLYEANIKL